MILIRSALFQVAFYLWTALSLVLCTPLLLGPRRGVIRAQDYWARGALWLLQVLAGIRLEVRGREHLPQGAAIVASKHQSAFDTFIYHLLLPDPAIVMKRELMLIPFYGWYARRAGMIVVDRKAGANALKRLVRDAKAALGLNRQILIFPEGTRTAPGVRLPYQPGVVALYSQLNAPLVPVALNSGLHWPRRRFRKYPGTITIEFQPPIPPGLPRKEFSARLEQAIESASDRLAGAAGRRDA